MDQEANLNKKFAHMKSKRVKINESFVPSLEDEAVQVQYLLAKSKLDHASVDDDARKHLDIEHFSYEFEYGLKRNCGGLDYKLQ